MATLNTDSPRIRILTVSVLVTVTAHTVRHYAALLGVPYKPGWKLQVPPYMLPAHSGFDLHCECPECGKQFITPASSVTRYGHTLCQPCRQREGAYSKYIGQTIGRLTITGFAAPTDSPTGGQRTTLTAICACGNSATLWGQTLRRAIRDGRVCSCGCYTVERARDIGRSNAGSANGMWRHDLTLEERHGRKAFRKILRTWSKSVRRRDGGKCVICGSTTDVHAHHLSGVNTEIESSLTLANGVTLCRFHHQDFHCHFMGHVHAPVTPADFVRYCAEITQQSQPA